MSENEVDRAKRWSGSYMAMTLISRCSDGIGRTTENREPENVLGRNQLMYRLLRSIQDVCLIFAESLVILGNLDGISDSSSLPNLKVGVPLKEDSLT